MREVTDHKAVLPTRRSDVITRDLEGELIILDRAAGNVHQLNATASSIWNQCDGAHSTVEIAACVAVRFDQVPETILDDVVAALSSLRQLGLIVDRRA